MRIGLPWRSQRFPGLANPSMASAGGMDAAPMGALAFKALLREPRLLHRLPREQARRIANLADDFAAGLIRRDKALADWGLLSDRASHVARVAGRWMSFDAVRASDVEAMLASARDGSMGFGECLVRLAREAPDFSEAAGALAIAAVIELDAPGINRLSPPHASVLLLAATRHAAGFLRGECTMPHARPGGEADAVTAALALTDRFHAQRRTLPLEFRLSGSATIRSQQAVSLWRDAVSCGVLFSGAPGARRWRHARDVQAFAALLARPGIIDTLVADQRARLAEDASRVAQLLLDTPAGATENDQLGAAAEAVLRVASASRAGTKSRFD